MKPGIRTVATRSRTLVAICRKCGKKLGGGFGDGASKPLAKALKQHLDLPKWKRSPVRIVETGCMKLCPKGAVATTTSNDASLVYVIPAATPLADVAARLGLSVPAAANDGTPFDSDRARGGGTTQL